MKKMVILLTALVMVAGFSTVAFAATISGSSHDLSDSNIVSIGGTTLGQDEICIFCHVPHTTAALQAEGPLWNHTLTTQNFTPYGGGAAAGATGISRLCLSCHDGVTNLDAFGGGAGTASKAIDDVFTGTTANVGTDLTDDHPVMVTYTGDGTNFKTTPDGGAQLFSGEVECASCHNPHDQTGAGGTKFLRSSNTNSTLCLGCHIK
jgi:predicted CXXCH cytochrome family protein